MLDPMFEVPGSNVKTVHIEEDTVRGKHAPRYEYHSDSDDSNSKETAEDSDETGAPEGDVESVSSGSEDVALEQSAAAKAKV